MYILLFLFWVALNGKITIEVVILGIAISGLVYAGACKYFEYSPKNDIIIIKNIFLIIEYIFVLLVEIVKANFIVLKLTYAKKLDIQPQIVFFSVPLKSEFLRIILANSITLTPGTITISVEEQRFCVHALDYTLAEGVEDIVFLKLLMKMEGNYDTANI